MAYGDLNYTTEEINADLEKVHDKLAVVEEAPSDGKQYGRKDGAWAEIEASTQVVSGGSGSVTKQINPNTFYKFGACSSLTVTFGSETIGIINEYMFEFVSGSTATTLSVPSSVKWSGGSAPTIEASKTYQVSIVNNLAVFAAF